MTTALPTGIPADDPRSLAVPVHRTLDSPVGPLTVVACDGAVTAILFEAHRHPLPAERVGVPGEDEALAAAARQLCEYFAGDRTEFELPLAPAGNPFQQRVWALLRAIPYGETRSYGQLAAALGDPGLARAVGAANGRNPISVVVPCHRVIGADGRLVGYGGGLERKEYLLRLEASVVGTPGLF